MPKRINELMLERDQVYLRPVKSLGQHFLVNRAIAQMEAEHARGKRVLELGPGYGVLTRELCKKAKRVVAVELDKHLYTALKGGLTYRNLTLINGDFFKKSGEELKLADTDIMIANVPYNLSSKTIEFLLGHRLQAVLCLQKEFVQHMTAEPGTRNYSRLSVMFQLGFGFTKIASVSRGSFRPMPRVDSVVIYVKPRGAEISEKEKAVISAMMQHKKKSVRNALADSRESLGVSAADIDLILEDDEQKDEKIFRLSPEQILAISMKVGRG